MVAVAASPNWNELPAALVVYDSRGQVVEANDAATSLLGIQRESLLHRGALPFEPGGQMLPCQHRAQFGEQCRRCAKYKIAGNRPATL